MNREIRERLERHTERSLLILIDLSPTGAIADLMLNDEDQQAATRLVGRDVLIIGTAELDARPIVYCRPYQQEARP